DEIVLDHAVALFHLRLEEATYAGPDEDVAVLPLHQQRPAAEGDAVLLVGVDPAGPQGLGGVAEHGAAVQSLTVAFEGGESTHWCSPWPAAGLTRRPGACY